jgi:hypothetical protein
MMQVSRRHIGYFPIGNGHFVGWVEKEESGMHQKIFGKSTKLFCTDVARECLSHKKTGWLLLPGF